jgi:hypothetical protein
MVDDLKLLKVILANPTRSLQENYAEAGITPPTAKNAPSFGSEGNPGNVNAPKRDDKKGGGDSLRGVNSQFKIVGYDENGDPIFGDPKDKESPREKAIKAISAAMRTSITVATELQNRLDRIKDAKTATDLSAALGGERGLSLGARVAIEANSDGATSSDAKLRSGKRPSLQPDGQVDVSTLNKKMKEYLDSIDTIPGALFKAGEQWMKFANDALSANNIVSDALGGLYSALESGLGTVFANLTNKTQTFKSAMKTIFSAIAQEVLAILSRIAAAAVFKLVLSFILGPEAAAAVMAGGAAGSKLTTGTPAPLLNVTINAIDKNGIYQSLTAPRGELRSAFGAAMTAGAY